MGTSSNPPMRKNAVRVLRRLLLVAAALYLVLAAAAGITIAEVSLKLPHRPLQHQQEVAAAARNQFHAELQNVSITAADGIVLRAWYVHPPASNGSAVVLLHGITDNREGVAGYAGLFLQHGYSVLLPDARAHGESGGVLATYGIKESDDFHRWVSWLYEHDPPQSAHSGANSAREWGPCVYGFGESYGAALTLQSLTVEKRLCAVAVESPFSTAQAMSYERVSGPLHLKPWFGKTFARPVIWSAVLYARLRYGVNLLQPSPLEAVRRSATPVLLIHGANDISILAYHSQLIAQAAPDHVQLWLVPNAGHTQAWRAAHQEFESRVLGWFASHRKIDRQIANSVIPAESMP